ncbi:MAG: AAA family ATPase [Lachnospiraceae bacterium]|nr:AAA family ATPase [Lachnospiraceae bacterium]
MIENENKSKKKSIDEVEESGRKAAEAAPKRSPRDNKVSEDELWEFIKEDGEMPFEDIEDDRLPFSFDNKEGYKESRVRRMESYRKKRLEYQIQEWLKHTSFSEFYVAIEARVMGQKNLRIVLGNVYNYLYNVANNLPVRNNMILSAPSGCGKTETYRALRDYFKEEIPKLKIHICDVSQVTVTGFRGNEPSTILLPFLKKGGMQNAEEDTFGIVFMDEFDKKLMPIYSSSGDNVNREVQANLLTIIEGGIFTSKEGNVNTEKLMFVGLGSFDEFRENTEQSENPIGLGKLDEWEKCSEQKDHYRSIDRESMVEAGGSNELIGRFPYIVSYDRLEEDAIRRIILKSASEVEKCFDLKKLVLKEGMMDYLIKQANSKFGCRQIENTIRNIVLENYTDALFKKEENKELTIYLDGPDKVRTRWTRIKEDEEEFA